MFQETVYRNRIVALKKKLEPNTFYLFSNPSHIRYFTGFEFLVPNEREAFFVCSSRAAVLIHTNFAPITHFDFLQYLPGTFPSQLLTHFEEITSNLELKNEKQKNEEFAENVITQIKYDPQTLFVAELDVLKKLANTNSNAMPSTLVSELMEKKDDMEIAAIKKACAITREVFDLVKSKIRLGITEIEIAQMISDTFSKKGITELAFPSIVAFGANSAHPHHQPGTDTLEENMVVLIDMGGKFDKYCADMTRTFWFGTDQSDDFNKIETIVTQAYDLALSIAQQHTKKPILAKDIDIAARSHISNQGFGESFIHTTGHGLGLDIHEQPSLSWRNTNHITQNMVLTIEPGIYLEGSFGYRYENTILISAEGCEVLTK